MRCLFLLLCAAACWAQRQPLQFDIQWVNPPTNPPRGVRHVILKSPSMKQDVGFNIYLPPDYDSSGDRRYPVLYWLHGAGGHESQGVAQAALLDKAITAGRELIPHVDSHYRTQPAPFGRAIEGMSMGGNGALKLALKYPEMFGNVLAIAGSYRRLKLDGYYPGIAAPQQEWVSKLAQWYSPDDDVFTLADRNMPRFGHLRIRLLIGTQDVSFQDSEVLHTWLRDLSIPHEYEILLGVAHNTTAYYERAGIHGFEFQAAGFARLR
jgi:enterochelin esterase-like enzyme